MKASFIFVALSATLLVMSGCRHSSHQEDDVVSLRRNNANTQDATADSTSVGADAALPERKFIRTSEMKFRVKDVSAATTQIENIVRLNNGFVTYTHLKSNVAQQKTVQKSMDSSLESIQYTMDNDIVLRVPNIKLDSTMNAIAALVDYMDYRVIKADDVALQIKANQKAQRRVLANQASVQKAIATRKGKIQDATAAAAISSDKQKEADDAEVSNLSLMDQVAYSTVNLSIYQRVETKYWVIANTDNNLLKTNIGIRIWDSIKTGWYFAEDIFVGILNLWFVVALGLVGYFFYRRYAASRKKPSLLPKS